MSGGSYSTVRYGIQHDLPGDRAGRSSGRSPMRHGVSKGRRDWPRRSDESRYVRVWTSLPLIRRSVGDVGWLLERVRER